MNAYQIVSADVVRIQVVREETSDGTIELRYGVSLVENARELMMAAACSALEPRAYFATRKPDQANDFTQRLRLAQTEAGGYVLRIVSSVPPRLASVHDDQFQEPEPPFERMVSLRLMQGLSALRAQADEALHTGAIDGFANAISQGVSANLCTALASMGEPIRTAAESLRISVSWAKSRPPGRAALALSQAVFPGDRFPIIQEAARWLKTSVDREDVEVRGAVIKLQRHSDEGALNGPVTIFDFSEGKPRKVQVLLSEKDHRLAVRAYERRSIVVCSGQLTRAGQHYSLRNPWGFDILHEEEIGRGDDSEDYGDENIERGDGGSAYGNDVSGRGDDGSRT